MNDIIRYRASYEHPIIHLGISKTVAISRAEIKQSRIDIVELRKQMAKRLIINIWKRWCPEDKLSESDIKWKRIPEKKKCSTKS